MSTKDSIDELKLYVTKISKELEKKVSDLDDEKNKQKALEIKKKAQEVLVEAYNKVVEAANDLNSNDISNLVDHAIKKSKNLYNDACSKIDTVVAGLVKDEDYEAQEKKDVENIMKAYDKAEELYGKASNQVKEFVNKPEVQNTINEVKNVTTEIAEKAVDTLKEWLNPDNK